MADVLARDVIRVLPMPDGRWRWVRDRRAGRHIRREWTMCPCIDHDTAVLDALGLLVEDPGAPRRARLIQDHHAEVPSWRVLGWTAWGP